MAGKAHAGPSRATQARAGGVAQPAPTPRAWWRGLSGYQWLVFWVASAAWLFDTLDQRLFSLARIPALSDLMHLPGGDPSVQGFAKVATAWFLIGWGLGGLGFGPLGDRYGRARMLTVSILVYALCTGATALVRTPEAFVVSRFATGLGIGGVFGLAVALVAETASAGARLAMLGVLQVLSTFGNVGAALVKSAVDGAAAGGLIPHEGSWRPLFLVGAAPALLAVISALFLKESETWARARASGGLAAGGLLGPYAELFGGRDTRRNLAIGTLLCIAGVVGLWAIGEYAVDLQDAVFTAHYKALGITQGVAARVAQDKNIAYVLQMLGAAAGMLIFTWFADRLGRRPAFLIGFVAALAATVFVYARMSSPADAFWMMPLMGAAQFSVFAGFSIYLPELFPSRVRSTAASFAYNLGRFAAAAGSFFSAALTTQVFAGFAAPAPLRYSAIAMCAVFLVGVATALAAPETRGRPLPA